jgi:hypothetical protein
MTSAILRDAHHTLLEGDLSKQRAAAARAISAAAAFLHITQSRVLDEVAGPLTLPSQAQVTDIERRAVERERMTLALTASAAYAYRPLAAAAFLSVEFRLGPMSERHRSWPLVGDRTGGSLLTWDTPSSSKRGVP